MIDKIKNIRAELMFGVEHLDLNYIKMQINKIDTIINDYEKQVNSLKLLLDYDKLLKEYGPENLYIIANKLKEVADADFKNISKVTQTIDFTKFDLINFSSFENMVFNFAIKVLTEEIINKSPKIYENKFIEKSGKILWISYIKYENDIFHHKITGKCTDDKWYVLQNATDALKTLYDELKSIMKQNSEDFHIEKVEKISKPGNFTISVVTPEDRLKKLQKLYNSQECEPLTNNQIIKMCCWREEMSKISKEYKLPMPELKKYNINF